MDLRGHKSRPEHSVCKTSVGDSNCDGKPQAAEPEPPAGRRRAGKPREWPSPALAFRLVIAVAAVPITAAGDPAAAAQPTAHSGAVATSEAPAEEPYDVQVIKLVNDQRAQNGCQPLRDDPAITTAAHEHSRDMGTNRYFGHDDQKGVTPWTRMKDAGYDYPAAENIAVGYSTPRDVVASWMGDPPHRANILNCSYKAAGVGYFPDAAAVDGNAVRKSVAAGGPWWTQDFGYQ